PNFLGSGVSTVSDLILKIVNFLMTLALPFAVLMLVWAGFQFATAQGSEEKLRTARRNLIWTVVGVLVILAAREIVGYITELLGGTGTSSLMTKINNLLTQVYVFLFLLVTVYFFWGIVKFVRASATGGKEMEEGKRHMIWGIVGMAVMAGAWGIVAILQSVLW
ncbi:pilin, partial [Patescibacteria group bacterium]|nr:pilin [Patescibacteria group bacterium]